MLLLIDPKHLEKCIQVSNQAGYIFNMKDYARDHELMLGKKLT